MKQELIKWTKRIGEEVAKRSPLILTVVAVAGTAATAVLAGKATLRAKSKLDTMKDLEEQGHEKFTTKEKVKNIAPIYIPTILMFSTTSACIIGAHQIDAKRQLALASAYSLSTEALKEVESKVKETYGEKKFQKLKDEISEEKGRQAYVINIDGIIDTGHGDQIFADLISGQVFKSSMEYVNRVLMDLKQQVLEGEEVTLNELYRRLGIREVKYGSDLIWEFNRTGKIHEHLGHGYIDPEAQDIVCHTLDFYNDPVFRREY